MDLLNKTFTFTELKNSINDLLKDQYLFIRLVDPVKKKIIRLSSNGQRDNYIDTEKNCYNFWAKNGVCENCISMRSIRDSRKITKIESGSKGKLYMVTAIPINVDNKKCALEFLKDVSELDSLDDIIRQDNMKLKKMLLDMNDIIIHDVLTCTYNKGFIHDRLPAVIYECIENNSFLSLVMFDIDNFKHINDTYGHLAGDEILKYISCIAKENIRDKHDWIARFGGDEFLICLPYAGRSSAFEIVDRIRNRIEKASINYKDKIISTTCSFGICTFKGSAIEVNEFLEASDKALYRAKYNGRNKIEVINKIE